MDEKQEENNEDLKIKGNKALKAKTSSFQFFASFFSRQKIYHISPRPNKTNYIQIKFPIFFQNLGFADSLIGSLSIAVCLKKFNKSAV